jgi:hypothetical protein
MKIFNFLNKKKEPNWIGELYCGLFRGMSITCFCPVNALCGPGQRVSLDFYRFSMDDITEINRNKIKLFGDWYYFKDIVFYNEKDYEEKKKKIEKRYKKQNTKTRENNVWCAETESEIKNTPNGLFGLNV